MVEFSRMVQAVTASVSRQPDKKIKHIAIIGAGAAGICMAKYMREAGFDVTVFEIGTKIGGMWCYENDNGLSSAYRTLHINTSRGVTRFHDLDFNVDVQSFPDHWDMHQYLEDYAKHFDIVPLIRFNTTVTDIHPAFDPATERPRWNLELENGTIETFDTVLAASGHLSDPLHVPMFRDDFAGTYVHSHHYKEPENFVGQRICVIGVGNSACDIASDVCVTSPRCVLVARSGAIILPKLFCGIPFTDITRRIQRHWIPGWLRRKVTGILTYLVHGDMKKLGFRPMEKRVHTTSNGTIVTDIAYSRITVKHEIEKIDGKTLHFADGTSEEFDTIIAATGYQIQLPFISRKIVPLENNKLRLYKRMVQPGWPGLYFPGFFNTDTALNMIFEHQARWIRDIELGDAVLPSESDMWADIEAQERWVGERFKETPRHTIEEEHVVYLSALKKSMRLMKRLAKLRQGMTVTP